MTCSSCRLLLETKSAPASVSLKKVELLTTALPPFWTCSEDPLSPKKVEFATSSDPPSRLIPPPTDPDPHPFRKPFLAKRQRSICASTIRRKMPPPSQIALSSKTLSVTCRLAFPSLL